MRTRDFKDMSLFKLRQMLSRETDGKKIRIIKIRISYLEKGNEEAVEKYQDSLILRCAAKLLRKEGRTKSIMVDNVLTGYEYDWGDAILKLHEVFNRKELNGRLKGK